MLSYNADMAGRPPLTPPKEIGARLASFRKEAGMSQAQLAQALGITQRSISFYEREANYIPSTLLPRMAEILGVSVENIIGANGNAHKKRGPKSRLERQLDLVKQLPKNDQQFVSKFLEQVLAVKR